MARGRWRLTNRPKLRFTSVIWAPPKPRLITGKGAMSTFRLAHRRMLESPTKTMPQTGSGAVRSSSAKRRISSAKGSWAASATTAPMAMARSRRAMRR